MRHLRRPILITGAARSGTSMTAGCIDIAGAWGGQVAGPTRYNAKGMFENSSIRNDLVKPFLRSIHADPMGQDPLPDSSTMTPVSWWKDRVLGVAQRQGLREGRPWYYKGAKMCLMWPVWAEAFPEARWIIVRRYPGDIANSCMKTGFMRAFGNDRDGWLGWVRHHEARFNEMKRAGLDVREVWPTKMIGGDFTEIERVTKDLGLDWHEDLVREFINPKLWHGGSDG